MRASIVGIGWLGEQMADFLLEQNISVLGTTTSVEKAKKIRTKGIEAVCFDLKTTELNPQFMSKVAQSDWIIFTIPPSNFGSTYAVHCIRFFEQIQAYAFKGMFIYTSSTSVYGNKERVVNETSKTDPHSENAKQIVKVENLLKTHFDRMSIWRMGGLVGPNRHPINFLAGKIGISKPLAPINLVHSVDVIKMLRQFIDQAWEYPLLNLCSPEHPHKKEYYTQVAENRNKSLPKFDEQDYRKDKIVNSIYITEAAFSYSYPSPFDYPQAKYEM